MRYVFQKHITTTVLQIWDAAFQFLLVTSLCDHSMVLDVLQCLSRTLFDSPLFAYKQKYSKFFVKNASFLHGFVECSAYPQSPSRRGFPVKLSHVNNLFLVSLAVKFHHDCSSYIAGRAAFWRLVRRSQKVIF